MEADIFLKGRTSEYSNMENEPKLKMSGINQNNIKSYK